MGDCLELRLAMDWTHNISLISDLAVAPGKVGVKLGRENTFVAQGANKKLISSVDFDR